MTKASPKWTDRCRCKHVYSAHVHKAPHRCTECVCEGFARPLERGWLTSAAPTDPKFLAVEAAAHEAMMRVVERAPEAGEEVRIRTFYKSAWKKRA